MMWMDSGAGWWPYGMGFGLHWLVTAGLLGLVAWAVISLFRPGSSRVPPRPAEPGESALEVLKVRYARGELNRDDYRTMRKELAA